MLTREQEKFLRKEANGLPALLQLGKGGMSENFLKSLDDDLEAHELVKVNLLKTCDLDVKETAADCAMAVGADVVQAIGRTFILYRRSKENKLGAPL